MPNQVIFSTPNYVHNLLTVTGSAGEIDRLIAAVKGPNGESFSCQSILPTPPELLGMDVPAWVVEDKDYEAKVQQARLKQSPLPITRGMQLIFLSKYNADNWYEWQCDTWGSERDVCFPHDWERTAESASLFWLSAWTPHSPIIAELARRFPKLKFTLNFVGVVSCEHLGFKVFEGGHLIAEEDLDWDSPEGVAFREELGYDWCDEDEDYEYCEEDEDSDEDGEDDDN